MVDNIFYENLRKRYNYNDKTIKALSIIVPKIISYYGHEHIETILNALLNCEIIPCSSEDTISSVMDRLERDNISFYTDIDLKKGESLYTSSVNISYNELKNKYEIENIDRVIITSHTHNFDSLKGQEILTHAICHLIKSYNNEFEIDENNLIVRNGISYDKYKIIYNEKDISLEFIETFALSLEEGFTIYDTEKIVSLICNDNYKCYDYNSIYNIAFVLKDRYKMQKEINDYEMYGNYNDFYKKYGNDNIEKISSISDEALEIENEMIMTYTKEDKDLLKDLLDKKLNDDAYNSLIDIYTYQNIIRS